MTFNLKTLPLLGVSLALISTSAFWERPTPQPGLASEQGGIVIADEAKLVAMNTVLHSLELQQPNPDAASEQALLLFYAYLNDALVSCEHLGDYTAVLEQQVQLKGKLNKPERIAVKLRETPFSVYLKWEHDGQQVLYVDGEHDGRLIARPTNGLAVIRSVWKLDPNSRQGMAGSRYPVTELGLTRLTERVKDFYIERESREGMICVTREEIFEDRPVRVFEITFASPAIHPEYSFSKLIFDAVDKHLIGVENSGWTKSGQPGQLLEKYLYHELDFQAALSDEDFSLDNPTYKFAVR